MSWQGKNQAREREGREGEHRESKGEVGINKERELEATGRGERKEMHGRTPL